MEVQELQTKKRQLEIDLYNAVDKLIESFCLDTKIAVDDITIYLTVISKEIASPGDNGTTWKLTAEYLSRVVQVDVSIKL